MVSPINNALPIYLHNNEYDMRAYVERGRGVSQEAIPVFGVVAFRPFEYGGLAGDHICFL